MLRRHTAIINLARGIVTLSTEEGELAAEIIGSQSAPQCPSSFFIREDNRLTLGKNTEVTESKIWQEKIEEIIEFQNRQAQEIINVEQKQQLIKIYDKSINICIAK